MFNVSKIELSKEDKETDEEIIKEEVNLQYHWYLFSFFVIYFISFLIPGIVFFLYCLIFFVPKVMDNRDILLLFTQFDSLLSFLLMPIIIIGCYLLHLLFVGIVTRWLWNITEKNSPTKDGVIPRNIRSKTLNYYHIRSFMIKYPKYIFTKGPFPWLANWLYNFVGSNKIGKGTTIEEQVCADKYIDVGKNCYIGVNSVLTSHLVEGIFGNISYFEINVGDNTTTAGLNCFASGCELGPDSYLLPWASGGKHYKVKGDNFYSGLPLRKIFKSKIEDYLKIPKKIQKSEASYRTDPSNLEALKKSLKEYNDKRAKEPQKSKEDEEEKELSKENPELNEQDEAKDYKLDFTTSSAISKMNIKFLALYIPIIWFSGLAVAILAHEYLRNKPNIFLDPLSWIPTLLVAPAMLFLMYIIFIAACLVFTKLFIVLANLVHQPKEGIFKAETGDTDFDFWCLRTELKKLPVILLRNSPIPYMDAWALRWLGISMDFSSHLNDAWCDTEFIEMGRKVMVGQGAVIMSSMVVGKYLLIKKVILDDYVVVGGQDTIAPGTIIGKESVIGALSSTNYGQLLEDGWIYFGVPAIQLKENKYAETARDKIRIIDVDGDKKYHVNHDVNIDEDKKHLVQDKQKTKKEEKK